MNACHCRHWLLEQHTFLISPLVFKGTFKDLSGKWRGLIKLVWAFGAVLVLCVYHFPYFKMLSEAASPYWLSSFALKSNCWPDPPPLMIIPKQALLINKSPLLIHKQIGWRVGVSYCGHQALVLLCVCAKIQWVSCRGRIDNNFCEWGKNFGRFL